MSSYGKRTIGGWFFIVMVSCVLPAGAFAQRLYVPVLQGPDSTDVGLAFTNPTLLEIALTLTALNKDGTKVTGEGIGNPIRIVVPPSGQRAMGAREIFGESIAGISGSIQIDSSSSAVKGFFLLFDSLPSSIDGGGLQSAGSRRIVFPKVTINGNTSTFLSLLNMTGTQSSASIVFYSNDGTRVIGIREDIPAGGTLSASAEVISGLTAFDGYAVAEALNDTRLIGFETYRGQHDTAALDAVSVEAVQRLAYFPHIASGGGYFTRVSLINVAAEPQTITITAHALERNGAALRPADVAVERTIPVYGRIEESAANMFQLDGSALTTGYVQWETRQDGEGVIGYLDYGTTDGVVLSAVPAQVAGFSDIVFSHIAQGLGYYTGLVFLNVTPHPAAITIEALDRGGKVTGETRITLSSESRRSYLLSELLPGAQPQFGGSLRVTSSRPVFAFELFGSSDSLRFLSNVTPQGTKLEPQTGERMVTATLGAQVLSTDAMASVAIAPGALELSTLVSIWQPALTSLPSLSGNRFIGVVQALPSGTRLRFPATVTFPLAAQLSPGTRLPILVLNTATQAYSSTDFVAIVDESGRTASGKVTYFSIFALTLPATQMIEMQSLEPATGVPGTAVIIRGTGFSSNIADNVVTFAGAHNTSVSATVVSATTESLNVTVPSGAQTGNVIVRTRNRTSNGLKFTVSTGTVRPYVSALSPHLLEVGSELSEVVISGIGFTSNSLVILQGNVIPSNYVDTTRLTITVNGSLMAPGPYRVGVKNAPDAAVSNTEELMIAHPTPVIRTLNPEVIRANVATDVTILGSGFTASSEILIGENAALRYVNSTTLTFTVSVGIPGVLKVNVRNPKPRGGLSNGVDLTIAGTSSTPSATVVIAGGNGQIGKVGRAFPAPLSVRVTDPSNNPLSGRVVVFKPDSYDPYFAAASAVTDNYGEASAFVTAGSTAGVQKFIASAGGAAVTFNVVAEPAEPANLAFSTDRIVVRVNETVSLTLSFTDKYGNRTPVDPQKLKWTVTPNAEISFSSGTESGSFTGSFRSTAPGDYTIRVEHSDLRSQITIAVDPSRTPRAISIVAGNDQSGHTGEILPLPLTVKVVDEAGLPIEGVKVFFQGSGNSDVQFPAVRTNVSGLAETTVKLGTDQGTQTFTAVVVGLPPVKFSAWATAGHATRFDMTIEPFSIVSAGQIVTFVFTLLNSAGQIVTDEQPAWTLSLSPNSGFTWLGESCWSGGRCRVSARMNIQGSYTVTAGVQGMQWLGRPVLTTNLSVGPPPAPLSIYLVSSASLVRVNEIVTFTVALKDQRHRIIRSTESINWSLSDTNAPIAAPAWVQVTNDWQKGSLTAAFRFSRAGTYKFQVNQPGLQSASTEVTVRDGVPMLSIIEGNSQVGRTNEWLPLPFKVRATDAADRPMQGVQVTFFPGSGLNMSQPYGTTDANGEAQATGMPTTEFGPQTFQASIPGVPPVTFVAINTSTIRYFALSTSTLLLRIGETAVITITAKDEDGQTVVDEIRPFAVQSSPSAGVEITVDPNSPQQGVTVANFRATLPGSYTVMATTGPNSSPYGSLNLIVSE